jgi:hypothetical protein
LGFTRYQGFDPSPIRNDWCLISHRPQPREVDVLGALGSRRAGWTRAHRALGAVPRAASGAAHQLHAKLGESCGSS